MNKKYIYFLIVIFVLLISISIKAETKDVQAKYEYIESEESFEQTLTGNNNLNIDGIDVDIQSSSSDKNKRIALIPADNDEFLRNIVGGSEMFSAYYVDFYNSSNEKVNLNKSITINSVAGKKYDDAYISIVSSDGEIIYTGSILNNSFSFPLLKSGYVIFDYDTFRKGDINQDKLININDLILLRKHLAGIKYLQGKELQIADINGDKIVNINDLVKLKKYLAGIEEL